MQDETLDLDWSVLPYSPNLTPSDFHVFCSLNDKFSQKDQVKMFVEIFLSLKSAEFYLRGINKFPNKWQEMIQNNGEYTINWNIHC